MWNSKQACLQIPALMSFSPIPALISFNFLTAELEPMVFNEAFLPLGSFESEGFIKAAKRKLDHMLRIVLLAQRFGMHSL